MTAVIYDNFLDYAIENYLNPDITALAEFKQDIFKFSYVKRSLSKKVSTNRVLNQIVTLFNVFDNKACVVMLFYKVRKEDWPALKTILVFLNRMPDFIGELNILSSDISLDQKIVDDLRKI